MVSSHSKSFHRAFRKNELFKGQARRAIVWSGFGSILLCLLLFDVFLLAELLETHGTLELTATEKTELAEQIGDKANISRNETLGILPTVWRNREKLWGGALTQFYVKVPALHGNDSALMVLVAGALGIGFFYSLVLVRAKRLSTHVALDVATRLRRALHRQSLRLGPGTLDSSDGMQVHDLFTTQVDHVRDGVQVWVNRLGRYPFEILLLLLLAVSVSWRMSFYCLVPLFGCWYYVQRQQQRSKSARRLAEARADAELRLLAESYRKTRIVRGFGMEDFEHARFQTHLERFREGISTVKRGDRFSQAVCRILVTFCLAVILFLVGTKVLQRPDDFSFSSAILLLSAIAFMRRPLDLLFQLPGERDQASLAADRIYRYLDKIPEVSQAIGAKFLQPMSKSLQFENVKFGLPNKPPILNGLDLKIPSGVSVAVISLYPLEARALAYLLPRFIEPQSGRILIDGEDIAWGTLESLRAETIYVGGKEPFFTGTVLENISCGDPKYSLQDVTEAAKSTHAHNLVLRLAQGYETVLGEHGEQLDAGQGFRLGLARAVLRDPALLIIDEPDDPLDDDTKSLLDDAYNRITRDRTTIFLPSRLSTLRRADHIVILHRGKAETIGKYADLVKNSELYRHWEYLRFNEFRHEEEVASP